MGILTTKRSHARRLRCTLRLRWAASQGQRKRRVQREAGRPGRCGAGNTRAPEPWLRTKGRTDKITTCLHNRVTSRRRMSVRRQYMDQRETGLVWDVHRGVPSSVCDAKRRRRAVSAPDQRGPTRVISSSRLTICFAMSVFWTIFANSSKSSLPSPFWSASIIAATDERHRRTQRQRLTLEKTHARPRR